MENEKKNQILADAGELFMRYGIKSVSMDDISRELKMSKKTLYKYVSDKNDLVVQIIEEFIKDEMCCVQEFAKTSENAIEELLSISTHVRASLKNVHPSIHFDLEKYYTDAWKKFQEYKSKNIYEAILKNLKRGIKEGLFRTDFTPEVIAKLHVVRIDSIFDPDVFDPEVLSFDEVHREIMIYHIHGIASQKGIEYLKNNNK